MGNLREIVAYPRDPEIRARTGLCVARAEGHYWLPPEALDEVMARELRPWTGPRPPLAEKPTHCPKPR